MLFECILFFSTSSRHCIYSLQALEVACIFSASLLFKKNVFQKFSLNKLNVHTYLLLTVVHAFQLGVEAFSIAIYTLQYNLPSFVHSPKRKTKFYLTVCSNSCKGALLNRFICFCSCAQQELLLCLFYTLSKSPVTP